MWEVCCPLACSWEGPLLPSEKHAESASAPHTLATHVQMRSLEFGAVILFGVGVVKLELKGHESGEQNQVLDGPATC